ncbi:hypothetical protein [Corynebacterium casei]|uniref:hypothetical protein n=1 Tax=Corynebacterium casei TaxID=160386 RepID=UPI003FD1CD1A
MPQLPLTETLEEGLDELLVDVAPMKAEGEFGTRSLEGFHALVAALLPMPKEQERLAAAILNDVSFFSRIVPFAPKVHVLAEPAILLLLAGNSIARAGEITPGHYVSLDEYAQEKRNPGSIDAPTATPQTLETDSLWQTTGGLVAGAMARIAKNRAEKTLDLRTPSRWGVKAVVLSNLGYSAAALGAGARPQGKTIGLYAGVWAAGVGAAVLAAKSKKVSNDMVPAVILGGAASATTAALASDESVFRSGSIAARGASHGANLHFAAEAMTFARAIVEGSIEAKRHKRNFFKRNLYSILGAAESSTSFIGHLLLADGLNRR